MPHPGISMHKLPIAGDSMGLVFVIGVIAMILIALPQARFFLALSVPTGVVIGTLLRFTRRN